MTVSIQKEYVYQIYNKNGVYISALNNVISEFGYAQDINSGAVAIDVTVELSADVSDIPVEPILDESGNPILDETGVPIYEERSLDVVGSMNPQALIQENNIIQVTEITQETPNGQIVFIGYIQSWEANLTGFTSSDTIKFVAVSLSVDLEDYILSGGDSVIASNYVDNIQIMYTTYGVAIAQIITPSVAIQLDKVSIGVKNQGSSNITLDVQIYQGNPSTDYLDVTSGFQTYNFGVGNTLLTTCSSINIPAHTDVTTLKTSTLDISATLSAGVSYYVLVLGQPFPFSIDNLWYTTSTAAPGSPFGQLYYARATINNASYSMGTNVGSSCLYMDLITASGNTTTTYTGQDPSEIVTAAIDNYNTQSGVVTYLPSTIDATGTTATYTFVVATILDAIKKALDLAPSNWYWYVDPADLTLYFKETATTGTHKFIKGRHFNKLKIGATVENVKNVVYFTGGDTGSGENLFSLYTNNTSIIAQGRRRLERRTDNRVTIQATADLIANGILDEFSGVTYNSPVTIDGSTYDISTINVGDTVQLEGFGNFADYLLLQVVRLIRRPDSIDITLGVLLQRQSDALVKTQNELINLQTIANPTAPS